MEDYQNVGNEERKKDVIDTASRLNHSHRVEENDCELHLKAKRIEYCCMNEWTDLLIGRRCRLLTICIIVIDFLINRILSKSLM